MYDDRNDPGPHSSGDPVAFRLMTNMMDIASAAGECAAALRADFQCETDATVAAAHMVARLKLTRKLVHDSLDESHKTRDHSREKWADLHADTLANGFAIYAKLREHAAVTLGNSHSEPLARLASKITLGFRLKGLSIPFEKIAA
jgi:hypothetical protein